MQRFLYILFQLDEARRYIEDGRLERVRLAFILLDNAVELQLERRIRGDLTHEEMWERLRSRVLEIPTGERTPDLTEIADWRPLTKAQKNRVDRFFDEKLKYLSKRQKHLDRRLVGPLNYLHRYRNEAYHNARVRPATILTAAVLILEINCELLLSMPSVVSSYVSDEDYSWIEERFGIKPTTAFINQDALAAMVNEVRQGILPTTEKFISTLEEHLESRFEELYDALDFVVDNTPFTDRAEALKESQYFGAIMRGEVDPKSKQLSEFKAPYSLHRITKIRRRVSELGTAADRLDAFHKFSLVEQELESIEHDVNSIAAEVDAMIQAEVDRIRGK